MKIALVSPKYIPSIGGVEFHVMKLAGCLAGTYDVDVEILTTDPTGKLPKHETIDEINITRFKSWAPGGNYHFSRELREYLRKNSNRYDIVHAHSYHDLPALYAAQAKSNNARLVFTPHYHGGGHSFFRNLLHFPYKLFGKNIFLKADAIICVSEYEKDLLISNFRGLRISQKIVIIPNGVDLDVPRRSSKDPSVKDPVKTVLYVGRLEKYKRVDALLRAMAYLNEIRSARLEIIGTGPQKNHLVKTSHRVNALRRTDKGGNSDLPLITFLKDLPREQLLQKYADADVLVNLSEREAYGLTVAEALAAGTPCVVADSGALQEWVDDKNCIGVNDPLDPKQVADAILSVSDRRVTRYGRVIDWRSVAEQTYQIYEKITSEPETRP